MTVKREQVSSSLMLERYLKAGFAGIYMRGHEEGRMDTDIMKACQSISPAWKIYAWSVCDGLVDINTGDKIAGPQGEPTTSPVAAIEVFASLGERIVMVAHDMHAMFGGPNETPNPTLVRCIKDFCTVGKQHQRALIITGCTLRIPVELEKSLTVMDFGLPSREELQVVLVHLCEPAGIQLDDAQVQAALDAGSGLTTSEFEDAVALSIIETDTVSPDVIYRIKVATVKKTGLVSIVEKTYTLDDIGGLELFKDALVNMRGLFTRKAREYGLPAPRSVLAIGTPGCGKSLSAKALAATFNIPMLRVNAGTLYGSLVGESEANWRRVMDIANAIRPCVIWVDEAGSLFAGHGGSSTDGGTTQRVQKQVLQDMQDQEELFFIFTENDIENFPDPLIDRMDVWYFDLPHDAERKEIWSIHIKRKGRNAGSFDLDELARLTDGFSGRQIEQLWTKAMARSFNEDREPTMEDVVAESSAFTVTSKLMATEIEQRRQRLSGRAKPASAPKGNKAGKQHARKLSMN